MSAAVACSSVALAAPGIAQASWPIRVNGPTRPTLARAGVMGTIFAPGGTSIIDDLLLRPDAIAAARGETVTRKPRNAGFWHFRRYSGVMSEARRGPYAKGIARREQILKEALVAYSESDSNGPSLRSIASRVGLSERGLLHYFASRDDLFVSILD